MTMRGATRDECERFAVNGETLRVGQLGIRKGSGTDPVYTLVEDGTCQTVFAALGTSLRITNVSQAKWPAAIRTIFGNQAEGTRLLAWTYPWRRYRDDQLTAGPPLVCLCLLRPDPWTIIKLWDLEGVLVEIIFDQQLGLALPTAEAQNQALAPVL